MLQDTSFDINYQKKTTASGAWKNYTQRYTNYVEWFSINHYPLNRDGDDGGPWRLYRVVDRPMFGQFKDPQWYRGPITVQNPSGYVSPLGAVAEHSDLELFEFGTEAISKSAPTNPAFDMSTSLGELMKDGIPAMAGSNLGLTALRDRSNLARAAGKDYLNAKFGWEPLIRDVRAFAKTVKQSDHILNNYRKNSGTKMRVAYEGGADTETNTVQTGNFLSSPSFCFGTGTLIEERTQRTWFRGAFKYHIPVADSTVGKFQQWASMSDHLLGWKVTPETLWNIAPWSWAADWFGNTGDILANVSNLGKDGLAMQYGYAMGYKARRSSYSVNLIDKSYSTPTTRYTLKEYKRRVPATPYGFGVDLESLSAQQIAIIAALGLSRT